MSDATSIPRRPRQPEDTEFDGLRGAGIGLLEELTGERWSDYNLHDPGVTILEHLCYGLTDLIYRTGFDVADHLTGPDGAIDFTGQALHLPGSILPCRPLTPADFRGTILSCVEEVDDAWVRPWPWRAGPGAGPNSDGGPGLYDVLLRPSNRGEVDEEAVLREVLGILSQGRNLGEDVATITVAGREVYHLAADVDVAGARALTEILTDIYRAAEDYVTGRPRPVDRAGAGSGGEGGSLDGILTGPAGCGRAPLVDDADYDPDTLFLADLSSRIQAVDGVVGVRNLRLVAHDEGEDAKASSVADVLPRFRRADGAEGGARWRVPWLALPGVGGEDGVHTSARIRLWRRGQLLEEPPDLASRYEAARGGHRLDRVGQREATRDEGPPRGEHRRLDRYRSVQRHFPAAYGVNEEGVPDSATDQEWLSAFHTKSYLLLPEQLLANYLANLQHLQELFSLGESGAGGAAGDPTYRTAPLGPEEIPAFADFYGEAGGSEGSTAGWGPYLYDPSAYLDRALAPHDDAEDRRSRLQDHMLAIFGEALAPRSRKGRDNEGALDESAAWLVRSRARLLRDIPTVTRDRGGAADYMREDAGPSGFQRRVALLLGVPPEAGFHVLEHVQLRPAGRRPLGDEAWRSFYGLRVSVLFPGWVGRTRDDDFRRRAEEVVGASSPAHVRTDCMWLSKERMAEFQRLEDAWRSLRTSWLRGLPAAWARAGTADPEPVDEAAAELVRFLWAEQRDRGH